MNKLKLEQKSTGIIPKQEIKVVVTELTKIEKRDGNITPGAVVDCARPETSALHKYFTWDDGIAAENYRKEEARRLIRHVSVVYQSESGDRETRAYVNLSVVTDDSKERGYFGIARVLSNSEMRQQMLERALDEAKAWKERYNALEELVDVFVAISKVEEHIGKAAK